MHVIVRTLLAMIVVTKTEDPRLMKMDTKRVSLTARMSPMTNEVSLL